MNTSLVRAEDGTLLPVTAETRAAYETIRGMGKRAPFFLDDDYTRPLMEQRRERVEVPRRCAHVSRRRVRPRAPVRAARRLAGQADRAVHRRGHPLLVQRAEAMRGEVPGRIRAPREPARRLAFARTATCCSCRRRSRLVQLRLSRAA